MYDDLISEPFQFNPLKHHLGFLRDFIVENSHTIYLQEFTRTIRHIGSSVMDIYSGDLAIWQILDEASNILELKDAGNRHNFSIWTGTGQKDYRIITLSDGSEWAVKYDDGNDRFIHIFPARSSPHTFRIKANTLKSAILYLALIGKDFISGDDLNRSRTMAGLSPIKEITESRAITEMIEILRVP